MKFEIINPSDKCFVFADSQLVASAAVILLGEGGYGLRDENGVSLPCLFRFGGDPNKEWLEVFGVSLSEWLKRPESRREMAQCLASFQYAKKRTSLNDIGHAAKRLAEELEGKS